MSVMQGGYTLTREVVISLVRSTKLQASGETCIGKRVMVTVPCDAPKERSHNLRTECIVQKVQVVPVDERRLSRPWPVELVRSAVLKRESSKKLSIDFPSGQACQAHEDTSEIQ